MTSTRTFDARAFRHAMGSFATGVTVVTCRATDDRTAGVTVNSFSSVSLDPPMVLWSLARAARSRAIFEASEHWAVHILSIRQEELSRRFATAAPDKFAGLEVDEGIGRTPLLRGCVSRLQCRTSFRYDGGDHIIFVGEVLDIERSEELPLVFHAGRYSVTAPVLPEIRRPDDAANPGGSGLEQDFLGYLLTRAHFQFHRRREELCARHGLSETDYFILSVLTIRDGRTAGKVDALIRYAHHEVTKPGLASLAERGLLEVVGEGSAAVCRLTPRGRDLALHMIAAAKAVEADVLDALGPRAAATLKHLLKHVISATDPGIPSLWDENF